MRKWARKVAHAKMAKAGLTRVNDHKHTDSYFSQNWREWVRR